MSEHTTGVYLTKAEALQQLTELRDQAVTAIEHAGVADRYLLNAKAEAYRLAMGIVRNIKEEPF